MLQNVNKFKGCRPIFVQRISALIHEAADDWNTDIISHWDFSEPFYTSYKEVCDEAEDMMEGLQGWVLDEVYFDNYVIDGNTNTIIYECKDEAIAEMVDYYSLYGETLTIS